MPAAPTTDAGADRVAAVRAFSRFYTATIGVLQDGLLGTQYTLTEARVLYELAQRDATEVAELRRASGIDAGYLSRMLARFEGDGLVTRERSTADARRQTVRLTAAGRDAFAQLDANAAREVGELLAPLADEEQQRLVAAMATVRELLGERSEDAEVALRPPQPGDLGWIIERNAALYAAEYDWDASYETLVARIVAGFAETADPQREAAWIAELGGRRAGCVICVRRDDRTAQLRLLLVEPWARGRGVGARLVEQCIDFARAAGYSELMLWTNDVLRDARRIYQRAGFSLIEEEPHRSFGHDLVGQFWSRALPPATRPTT